VMAPFHVEALLLGPPLLTELILVMQSPAVEISLEPLTLTELILVMKASSAQMLMPLLHGDADLTACLKALLAELILVRKFPAAQVSGHLSLRGRGCEGLPRGGHSSLRATAALGTKTRNRFRSPSWS
jgi:hypothetical protein